MKTIGLLSIFLMLLALCGCRGSGSTEDAGFDDGDIDDAWNGDGDETTDDDPEKIAWGWVTVLESGGGYIGYSSAGAYFAVEPSYPRSLPHHLDIPCEQVDQVGSCTLYVHPALLFAACDPPCHGDQECMYEGLDAYCEDLPHHWNLGTVTIEGLKAPVAMTPDDLDRYLAADPPQDLFDQGDNVTAHIAGGELGPFSLSATGVADLVIGSDTVELERGLPTTVSWTPADAGTRVQVLLLTGPHDPTRPTAAILCDVPDEDGSVTIDAALVDGFLNNLVVIQKFSRVTRYTRDVQAPFGKEIELIVGSVKGIGLIVP